MSGTTISYGPAGWQVPDDPIIPFIEGDGTGPDIWRASQRVFDAAVHQASGGRRRVVWREVLAGEKAFKQTGEWLPDATVEAIRTYRVAIKGPLTTPVGTGIRSLNVTLRKLLDLYACIRPCRYYPGVPSPVKTPEKLDIVIFRENTEDVYAGIEFAAGSREATRLREVLHDEFGKDVREDSAIGIKPMSRFGTERLLRKAIRYAASHGLPSVTLVHKGNIMKFTEGAFRDWGYEVAAREFADVTYREGEAPKPGQVIRMQDRIADAMFQQILLRPDEYSVLALPNLNGDYMSDAAAAQVGGLGMAPGGNVGDGYAVFEATHGTAPKYAGLDKINPCAVILSGAMMFEELGWADVSRRIIAGVEGALQAKLVTYDIARQLPGATEVSTSTFADQIIKHLG
jgi:isocitrate dehydrogenase